MGLLDSCPVRSNADSPVTAAFWNCLRTAILKIAGIGAIGETSFLLANSQAATPVTGLIFDKLLVRSAIVEIDERRKDDAQNRRQVGLIFCWYDDVADDWDLFVETVGNIVMGTTYTITSAGQVEVATDNMTGGSYDAASNVQFKAGSFNV